VNSSPGCPISGSCDKLRERPLGKHHSDLWFT
jgi:hypothetical protein